MPKVVRFLQLELQNFAGVRSQTVTYGDITNLSGRNGEGKSTIGLAPVWVLWGNDLFGKKFDPRPTTYEYDVVRASLLLSIDGDEYKFERGVDGGNVVYMLNDVIAKATEYKQAVDALLDQDEFMTLYFPAYFFGLHWTKQRELIMRRAVAPAKSEVLKHMPEVQSKKLDDLTKKHTLDDLEKIHGGKGGKKSKLEKEHIAAQSRTKTLKEQLDRLQPDTGIDLETAPDDIAKLDAKIAELEQSIEQAEENNRQFHRISTEIDMLTSQIEQGKNDHAAATSKSVDTHCSVCGQELHGEAKERAEQSHRESIKAIADRVNPLILKRKELRAMRNEIVYIETSEINEEIARLREAKHAIKTAMEDQKRRQELVEQVEQAKRNEEDTLTQLKESIFILDAIKAYRAKEAEIQAEKVQELFTRLSVRLFKYIKTTGEYESDFSIQMDGKDYVQLSTGERIEAGLELTEVLYGQSDMITPTFIDHFGEYTGPVAVFGQLITAKAVKDQNLNIETRSDVA